MKEIWNRKQGLIFATLAGSHMYGTTRAQSDIDIRGVCLMPVKAMLGLTGFDQFHPGPRGARIWSKQEFGVDSDDVQVYGINKFFKLCLDANPNIIELLFAPDEAILYESNIWRKILEAKDIFLSQKIIHTYAGYAYSQLSRILRHKRWLDDPPTEPDPYDYGLVDGSDGSSKWTNSQLKNAYDNRRREWSNYRVWRENRNPARAELERKHGYDTKHAAHLYRLKWEAEELLSTGHLTLPLRQRSEFLRILNGHLEFDEVVATAEGLKDYLMSLPTSLPHKPDRSAAESFLIELNLDMLIRRYW
jgi:predicted nucleotidyltransferase